MVALQNPNALLRNTQKPLAQVYQDKLSKAKRKKEDQASGRVTRYSYKDFRNFSSNMDIMLQERT